MSPDFEIETESSSEEEAVQEEVKKEKKEDGPGLEALVKPAQAPVSVTPSASTASLSQVGAQSCWNLHCHAAGLYGFLVFLSVSPKALYQNMASPACVMHH